VHPCYGYGDAEYIEMFDTIIKPLATEFKPDITIVAAGFDSGAGDECGYLITPDGYAYLTNELMELKSTFGKTVIVLEGGYNIPAISMGMEACIGALLGIVDLKKK